MSCVTENCRNAVGGSASCNVVKINVVVWDGFFLMFLKTQQDVLCKIMKVYI